MKRDKTSSTTKRKVAQNARTKGSEPSTKLKKDKRAADGGLIPIKKCQERKKVCRQIVASKQNCPQIKAGKTRKSDEKKITTSGKTKKQDVKRITKTGKTKDSKDKCRAYFSVELPEKDFRSMFNNFSDKIILNMPGVKQERIREIQCKIAGYETKKRNILKIVSQPGEKSAEILRTANALQKMKEKRTEKPKEKSPKEKRRKSSELPSTERKQIKRKKPQNPSSEDTIKNYSADPVSENENKSKEDFEDFIRHFYFPIYTRTSHYENCPFDQSSSHLFSRGISKPSPTMNQDSPLQPLRFNPFSGDAHIKDSTDAPAYQQTSSSQQFPSVALLNDALLLENRNRTLAKNQSPAVQQVSSTQQLASTAFSSNMAASNNKPALAYASSSKESTAWPFSNKMHLIGLREDAMNNLAPAFQQVSTTQSSAYAPFSRNATPNGCGKIITCNESLTSECASPLQQSTTASFSNVIPLNVYNASETSSEIINMRKKTFNQMCSNQKSSVKIVEDQSIIRDYIAGKENLLRSHVTAMDDSKHLKRDTSSDVSNLRPKILENIGKKTIDAAKDNKQNVLTFMDLSSNKCAGKNNPENLKDKVNSSASRIQQDNCNAENSDCNKNKYNFKFSTPIYNYVDFIPSYSETAASPDTSNISEVLTDNCMISNSSPSLNHNVLKAHLAYWGLPETLASPNIAKDFINMKNRIYTPSYGSDTSENSSLAFSEDRWSSNRNDLNTTVNSSSESVSSQRSSCDSCLVTSFSTDEEYEENGRNSSSSDCDTLRQTAGDSDISEEYSTNAAGEDLEQTESKFSLKSILSPTALISFNDEELRDGDNNPENLKDKVNSSASRIQQDNCNAENSDCNKNKYNFKFSTPIYNYVDFIPSYSETAASPDTSNISEVLTDNCMISNSSPSLNHNVLKAHLAYWGLPETLASPNIAKDFINMKNRIYTPSYGSDTSENSSLAFSEDRWSSNRNDLNTTVNSSSESVSSQRSSCDSCLVTSFSTDEEYEENGRNSSSSDCDTLRQTAGDSDISEEYSTNAAGEDLEQTESKFSLKSILSPTALISFNDEELRNGDNKRSSKRVTTRRKAEIKPFENGSLYWLKQGRCMRKNDCEPRETIPTGNSRSRNRNYDSLMIKFLMSSRSHEKGRSGNRGESCSGGISKSKNDRLQEQSSIHQDDKKNSKKINGAPEIQAAQYYNKMQLEQLSTNQILAQIGLRVLTSGRPSPKNTYLEKILTMCGYNT